MNSIYEIWLINNLCLWAVFASFKEGMIFGKLGEWIEKKLGEYWSKPLIGCPVCMPSIYGSIGFLIFITNPLYIWPVYVVTMVGANYIISQLISKHVTIEQE